MISNAAQSPTTEHAKATIATRPTHVLVIDDEERFRSGVRRILHGIRGRDNRYRVSEASDASSALELISKQRPDCVLLDYRMPGVDGLTALDRILGLHENLPVVMVTGHGDEETAVSALKSGASDYLVKGSITPETLTRAITNACEKERLREAVEAQRLQLFEAERQRVMIQSIGAACHHLGQPTTSIACYLELIRRQDISQPVNELLDQCAKEVETLSEILQDLQHVSEYRTVPYLPAGVEHAERSDEAILDIESPGD